MKNQRRLEHNQGTCLYLMEKVCMSIEISEIFFNIQEYGDERLILSSCRE